MITPDFEQAKALALLDTHSGYAALLSWLQSDLDALQNDLITARDEVVIYRTQGRMQVLFELMNHLKNARSLTEQRLALHKMQEFGSAAPVHPF